MAAPAAHRKFFDLPTAAPEPDDSKNDSISDRGGATLSAGQSDEPPHCPQPQSVPQQTTVKTNGKFCPDEMQKDVEKEDSLFGYIEENVIGKDKVFSGPYGLRKVVYCDYTASGRALSFIEDYISREVLPDYGNTHTTTTVTALQTTLFRNEARDIIRNAVHASEHDAVIFTGSGCTAAVHKLIHALHITEPPVVFVGPFEHHSNLLPWREAGAAVCRIQETAEGLVDLQHLKQELMKWNGKGRQLIGCFSAASNVTGVLCDVNAISVLLHRHGALALWDYATAGAYVHIDMNPVVSNSDDQRFVYKDAVFLSPHKFVGGVQSPGVLVAKKNLFKNPVPSDCGGGSVFFVRRSGHRYLQEAESREEGGTPAIVESIRAGLVFQLKEAIKPHVIMDREHQLTRYAMEQWSDSPNLVILGPKSVPRLAIFSFLIRHRQTGRFLHHNYVSALLNDLFGIQARGGCACAGPYAEDLLGISEETAIKIEDALVEDSRLDRVHLRRYREYSEREILRPGFVRLNLPFFANDEVIQFVVAAVKMVAEHAWKLLPQYTFNPETGEWRHRNHQVFRDRKWLGFISYRSGKMTYRDPVCPEKGPLPASCQQCLEHAQQVFNHAAKARVNIADQTVLFDDATQDLRWFMLPSEALSWLQDPTKALQKCEKAKLPFEPVSYPREITTTTESLEQKELSATRIELSYVGPTLENVSKTENKALKGLRQRQEGSSKDQASRRQTVARGRRPKLSKRCRSEERTVSTATASLVADGFFAALKNIGKETGTEDFAEGLRDALSQGFVNTVDDKESAGSTTPDNLNHPVPQQNGISPESSHIGEQIAPVKAPQDGLVRDILVEQETPSGSAVPKTDSEGEVHGAAKPAGVICLDGACFKKRDATPAPSDVIGDVIEGTGRHKWHPPNKKIFNPTLEALEEFNMIHDGDRLLVCLSGGKDSLSLLHTLRQYQFYAKKKGIKFDLGAVTVDPLTSSYDPRPLKGYLKQLGVPYLYEEQGILEAAAELPYEVASICSFCSRLKRGRIYAAARREGYNLLAMGQHIDDLAESFLMSVFHNGLLRTMKACYTVQEGDLRVIRPFVYVREKDLRDFAEQKKLPVIPENCPACFEAPKERHRMKQLLAAQEVIFPHLFHSIKSAIKPILSINKTGVNVRKLFEQLGEQNAQDDELDEM